MAQQRNRQQLLCVPPHLQYGWNVNGTAESPEAPQTHGQARRGAEEHLVFQSTRRVLVSFFQRTSLGFLKVKMFWPLVINLDNNTSFNPPVLSM